MKLLDRLFGLHSSGGSSAGESPPAERFSSADYRGLALDLVWGRIPKALAGWASAEECDRAMAAINIARDEYASLTPKKLRTEVMDWLQFYEDRTERARQEVGAVDRRIVAFDARYAAGEARKEQLRESLARAGHKLP